MKIDFSKLIYCYIIVFIAMAAGGYYNNFGLVNWYDAIEKPEITPPNSVFPIVWTILYTLIALAFYLAFHLEKSDKKRQRLNSWFLGLMFLHIVWSYAFFYTGYIAMALIVIIAIDILSYMILMAFWSVSGVSACSSFHILFGFYLPLTSTPLLLTSTAISLLLNNDFSLAINRFLH